MTFQLGNELWRLKKTDTRFQPGNNIGLDHRFQPGDQAHLTHGHKCGGRQTPEYRAWRGMIERCTNSKDPRWKDYSGRGIRVCDRWRKSFVHFLLDVGYRPSKDYSLDRFPDNNGNYEPGNVRWATWKEQARNKRNNHLVTFRGQTKCLSQWAAEYGIADQTLRRRLSRGWSFERAILAPIFYRGQKAWSQRAQAKLSGSTKTAPAL